MGKRTRSNTDDYNYIAKQVQKLNQKLRRARYRDLQRSSSSSSKSDSSSTSSSLSSRPKSPRPRSRTGRSSSSSLDPLYIEDVPSHINESSEPLQMVGTDIATEPQQTVSACEGTQPATSTANCSSAEPGVEPELDENFLKILGDDPSQQKLYGKNIQSDLATRLQHMVTSGLGNDARKELINKYLPPANCILIDAPALNPEAKAAIPDAVLKRDKAIEQKQKQLSSVASCLAEALTKVMAESKDTALIQLLMDACKLLCDAQYLDSITRRNFILNNLKKELKDQLSATKIDKLLFSEELSSALKTAKAIAKSSADMKQTIQKTVKKSSKPAKKLNWRVPPPSQVRPKGNQRTKEPAYRYRQDSSSKQSLNQAPTRSRRR